MQGTHQPTGKFVKQTTVVMLLGENGDSRIPTCTWCSGHDFVNREQSKLHL